jgi:hypothetical protein
MQLPCCNSSAQFVLDTSERSFYSVFLCPCTNLHSTSYELRHKRDLKLDVGDNKTQRHIKFVCSSRRTQMVAIHRDIKGMFLCFSIENFVQKPQKLQYVLHLTYLAT